GDGASDSGHDQSLAVDAAGASSHGKLVDHSCADARHQVASETSRQDFQDRTNLHADDLGTDAVGRIVAERGRPLVYGMPLDRNGARTDARQAARLPDAGAGAPGLRDLLVQPAGLDRRVAIARRTRAGL